MFIPRFIFPPLPLAWQMCLAQWGSGVNFSILTLAIGSQLLILDASLVILAHARLHSACLLLD